MAAVIKVPETPLTVEQMRPIEQEHIKYLREQSEHENAVAERACFERCIIKMKKFNEDYIRGHNGQWSAMNYFTYGECRPYIEKLGYKYEGPRSNIIKVWIE